MVSSFIDSKVPKLTEESSTNNRSIWLYLCNTIKVAIDSKVPKLTEGSSTNHRITWLYSHNSSHYMDSQSCQERTRPNSQLPTSTEYPHNPYHDLQCSAPRHTLNLPYIANKFTLPPAVYVSSVCWYLYITRFKKFLLVLNTIMIP